MFVSAFEWRGVLERVLRAVLGGGFAFALAATGAAQAASGESALSDEPIPLKTPDEVPGRNPPLIEIGPDFLGTGDIPNGIELPTGAVWTPSLWVFGDFRTALNYVEAGDGGSNVQEWVNRLDIFANLRLTGTERFLIGFRPFDEDNEFSGYVWEPASRDGFTNGLNFEPTVFFFEGEFGEIFPELDPDDTGIYDVGFSIGRQSITFQDGMMFNDRIDAVALTRDTVISPGIVDTRITALYGWGEVNRNDNREDSNAMVFGLFTESDTRWSTIELDGAYVLSSSEEDGDGLYLGAGATQRIGYVNTTFRGNASFALDDESAAVSSGALLFGQASITPFGTDDLAYLDGFWAIDNYASAARDDDAGGPLGQVGLLFAAVGLGNYGAPLGNRADDAVGGAVGYQAFFNDYRTQVVLEVGGRKGTSDSNTDAAAFGARFQQALGDRLIFRLDGYVRWQDQLDEGAGMRAELQVRF
jgi:hypothetical protein